MAPLLPTSQHQLSNCRSHLPSALRDPEPQDPDAFPEPLFFESLDDFYSYSNYHNSDEKREKLIKVKCESEQNYVARRFNRKRESPQLLICHDFQGGYNEESDSRGYTFEHWQLADLFVYFSHKRVSTPPPDYVKAAHRHGTKILGTLIFEWKESIPDLAMLLRGPSVSSLPYNKSEPDFSPYFAHALIDLAISRSFSGYLINIEVDLSLGFSCSGESWPPWVGEIPRKQEMKRNCKRLKAWVEFLRTEGRKRFRELDGKDENEWEIIWYDSVTFDEGELQWQDALTLKNKDFLDVSDGIFTNYTWARPPDILPPGQYPTLNPGFTGPSDGGFHPALKHSANLIDEMKREREDIFVGIDVFGRNCYGGLESWKSLEMIGPHRKDKRRWTAGSDDVDGLSVALFAPGWTWEHDEPSPKGRDWRSWFLEDLKFFQGNADGSSSCQPISKYFNARPPPPLAPKSESSLNGPSSDLLYLTNFTLGSGCRWFLEGKCLKDWTKDSHESEEKISGWTDFSVIQPKADCVFRKLENSIKVELVEDDAWYGGVSLKMESKISSSSPLSISTISIPKLAQSSEFVASVILKVGKDIDPSDIKPILLGAGSRSVKFKPRKTTVQALPNGWSQVRSNLQVADSSSLENLKIEENVEKSEVGEFGILLEDVRPGTEFLIGELRLDSENLPA